MPEITLGLDIGPNSIGWALLDEANQRIIDLGSRIFPEGVDNFDTSKEKSRNEQRRDARLMRRQVARRSRRERRLRQMLVKAGLFPHDPEEHEELNRVDPYELRAKALDERLTPCEIGRVFLHLNQRRGFLSNRKKDRDDKETKGMLAEISELARDMEATGARTLGEYLFGKCESFDHARRREDDHIRNRHTRRDMLEKEFDAIWEAQAKHHPQLLTETLRYGESGERDYPRKPVRKPERKTHLEAFGIHGIIFFQRKMYWPKSVVGLCELEPKEKRCPRADRQAQRFRLLQEVNNLRYIDPDAHEERPLDPGQRALLLDHLATREKATFDEIRKKLGFLESVNFNLERGKRPSLKGIIVDWQIAKAVGNDWHKRPEDDKNTIARMLIHNEGDDDAIEDRLVKEFGFSDEQADTALRIDFPPGYVGLSLKAIEKLLPHMERGLVYQSLSDPEQSALHAAGYLRRDELQRRLFDRLPDPARMNPRDCPIGDIPNPVVKRTLVELRKVVNAIIREYGKPDAVHVEMGRSVRMGPQARSDYNSRMREREKERDRAADEIRKYRERFPAQGIRVNRDTILRFLLWEAQSEECVYCQKTISQHQLFSDGVDVDHILPYSRCLDDSQANKVIAHRACNHDKGQRTPYEWLADSDPQRYEKVCQHVSSLMKKGHLHYGKYRKFLQKEIELDKFIARQLTDTGYIASATAEYLRCLFEHDHDVLGLKGQHTAELRRQWGLNTVLRHDELDLKNREDHRHHTVDAVIVALTNRRRLHELAKGDVEVHWTDRETGEIQYRQKYTGDRIDAPWDNFRLAVEEAVNGINVSHRAQRKVAGALHEDTFYGPTPESGLFVVRKPMENLSPNEIPLIRDNGVRRAVEQRLAQEGIEFGRGKKGDSKKWKRALCDKANPILLRPSQKRLRRDPQAQGIPVKKVRVYRRELTIQPIRQGRPDEAYVKPGAAHHLCIFEWEVKGKPKRDAVFVSQLEAANRVKNHEPLIQREPPNEHPTIPPNARFIMSLSRGEMVLANWKGQQKLLVFKTAASTTGQIWFAEHLDSRKSSNYEKHTAKANTLDARKVTVDALGRIRWAND